jgi:hypothetical protein
MQTSLEVVEAMDITGLNSVAGRYYALRGLLLVPTGVLLVAAGLTNMPPIGPEKVGGGAPYFLVALVVAAAGYIVANHYYVTRFGRIDPPMRTKVRVAVYSLLAGVGICIGITVDTQFDLPVTFYGASFAVSLLAYYRVIVGLRPYHRAIIGAFLVACLVPIWDRVDDKVSLVMIPMGAMMIAIGLLDHRELVASIRRVRPADVDR